MRTTSSLESIARLAECQSSLVNLITKVEEGNDDLQLLAGFVKKFLVISKQTKVFDQKLATAIANGRENIKKTCIELDSIVPLFKNPKNEPLAEFRDNAKILEHLWKILENFTLILDTIDESRILELLLLTADLKRKLRESNSYTEDELHHEFLKSAKDFVASISELINTVRKRSKIVLSSQLESETDRLLNLLEDQSKFYLETCRIRLAYPNSPYSKEVFQESLKLVEAMLFRLEELIICKNSTSYDQKYQMKPKWQVQMYETSLRTVSGDLNNNDDHFVIKLGEFVNAAKMLFEDRLSTLSLFQLHTQDFITNLQTQFEAICKNLKEEKVSQTVELVKQVDKIVGEVDRLIFFCLACKLKCLIHDLSSSGETLHANLSKSIETRSKSAFETNQPLYLEGCKDLHSQLLLLISRIDIISDDSIYVQIIAHDVYATLNLLSTCFKLYQSYNQEVKTLKLIWDRMLGYFKELEIILLTKHSLVKPEVLMNGARLGFGYQSRQLIDSDNEIERSRSAYFAGVYADLAKETTMSEIKDTTNAPYSKSLANALQQLEDNYGEFTKLTAGNSTKLPLNKSRHKMIKCLDSLCDLFQKQPRLDLNAEITTNTLLLATSNLIHVANTPVVQASPNFDRKADDQFKNIIYEAAQKLRAQVSHWESVDNPIVQKVEEISDLFILLSNYQKGLIDKLSPETKSKFISTSNEIFVQTRSLVNQVLPLVNACYDKRLVQQAQYTISTILSLVQTLKVVASVKASVLSDDDNCWQVICCAKNVITQVQLLLRDVIACSLNMNTARLDEIIIFRRILKKRDEQLQIE